MQRAVAPHLAAARPGIGAAALVPMALPAAYEPTALLHDFEDVVRHKPEARVPRLGFVRAWRALGERERAPAELEVLRRLHPGLASLVVAAGERS